MYSSVMSSQPQNSRLSQLNTPGFPAHPGQFSVRVFKTPTIGSYYGQPSKYDPGFQRSAAPTDYYSSSRYEDPPSRFPPSSDSQRPSQYLPPSIRTSNLTARDYPSRPPTQSNYIITRGNINDTYIYEQSDRFSQSEYDDTATNDSYTPSLSPTSPAMSTDSMIAMKSPLPSPLTEREPERGQGGSTATTRRNSITGNSGVPAIPVPPLPGASGSTMSRSYPGPSSGSHEDVTGPLRSGHHAASTPSSTSIPIPIPLSTSTTDTRPTSSSTSSGSYTTAPPSVPPPPPSASVVSIPQNSSGGYIWPHAIPSIPPSETESEDVSLEARMNAERNAVATGTLYSSPGATTPRDNNTTTIRLSNPVPPAARAQAGNERNSSPPGTTRPDGTRLHVSIPAIAGSDTDSDGTITEQVPIVARSPASSLLVESLEEGRASGYMSKRNSTVIVGDQQMFLPPFADNRWVDDQAQAERERRAAAPVSYSRISVPPPAPELRREYSTSRSHVSSTNATYNSSPPRATVTVQFAPPVAEEPQRQAHPQAPPAATPAPGTSRPRRGSQAGYPAPPPSRPQLTRRPSLSRDNGPLPRSELTRRPSDARDHAPPTRSSPPRQSEPRLDTSPRRQAENGLGLHPPESMPPPSSRAPDGYPPPANRPEAPQPPSHSDPYSSSSRAERRASPPNVLAGAMLRPQTTAPESSYRSQPAATQYRSQSNSPPEKYRPPPTPSPNDPYRTNTSDSYRSQSNVPYRPQSTAPSSHGYRATTVTSSEPYRSQSTVPQETAYRPQLSRQAPATTYAATQDASYLPQASAPTVPVPASSYPTTQSSDPWVPPTRTRANSGSWSRNASFGSTVSTAPLPPPSSKTPSPPSRHAQPSSAPRSNSRPTSPAVETPPLARVPSTARGDQRGPPPSYTASVSLSTSPPRDARAPTSSSSPRDARKTLKRHRGGGDESDSSTEKGSPRGKPMLTVRNPSPLSDTGSQNSSSPPRGASQSTAAASTPIPPPQNHAKQHYPNSTSAAPHVHGRRSTLPYDSRAGGVNTHQSVNDYGRRTAQLHSLLEQPQRRLSDGDRTDRPTFSFNPPSGPGRNAAFSRCVRWDENLICPSPVFPNRRKGWFNRRGDQLWTNEGGYKPPPPGNEYPLDLEEYPEYGEGWMNESGVRIDMTHHLIPKAPLRSALKQPKAIS